MRRPPLSPPPRHPSPSPFLSLTLRDGHHPVDGLADQVADALGVLLRHRLADLALHERRDHSAHAGAPVAAAAIAGAAASGRRANNRAAAAAAAAAAGGARRVGDRAAAATRAAAAAAPGARAASARLRRLQLLLQRADPRLQLCDAQVPGCQLVAQLNEPCARARREARGGEGAPFAFLSGSDASRTITTWPYPHELHTHMRNCWGL